MNLCCIALAKSQEGHSKIEQICPASPWRSLLNIQICLSALYDGSPKIKNVTTSDLIVNDQELVQIRLHRCSRKFLSHTRSKQSEMTAKLFGLMKGYTSIAFFEMNSTSRLFYCILTP